jgi:hypothetical protein
MKEFKKGELNICEKNKRLRLQKKAVEVTYSEGGKPVEMTKPNESQKDMVKGQGKILTEKKRSATWY